MGTATRLLYPTTVACRRSLMKSDALGRRHAQRTAILGKSRSLHEGGAHAAIRDLKPLPPTPEALRLNALTDALSLKAGQPYAAQSAR
jgi:hypothetical protein